MANCNVKKMSTDGKKKFPKNDKKSLLVEMKKKNLELLKKNLKFINNLYK